jgi:hypothetical protein
MLLTLWRAVYHVITLLELSQKLRDLFRGVLQIVV